MIEKDCQWFFGNEGGIDVGPNDPIHQTFKVNPYYSIVREAIQNSLDAVNDNRFPVNVSFQYFKFDRLQYPAFFQIEDHIKQSLEYFKNNADAKRLFNDMLQYINGSEKGKKRISISCLKISDSNTRGMTYIAGHTDSSFYAFLRAAGVNVKTMTGSGGSFGFGKGAYFALSPIKTVIVSSKDTDGNFYFEGATRLTTHKDKNGKKLTAYGFYDNNKGEPVVQEESVPDMFRRTQTGTDINIIGLWDEVDRNTLMIKSVLNNFWLAIHENKLVVTVSNVTISKENLEQVIDEYFSTEFESGNATEIESWNPKPYYKAVKYADANDQFKSFSDELETLGNVKFYVYLERGLSNRTAFFRQPKMVVFKRTNRKINGYTAVFVCESVKGNSILRMMENPAHNEWRKENYPSENGRINRIARKAENELSDYVNAKLDSLAKLNTSKKIAFLGLEDYLSIPEDLLEKDDDSDLPGNNTSNYSGHSTNEQSEEETALQTTDKDAPVTIKPTLKPKSEVKEDNDVIPDLDGKLNITTGGNKLDSNPNPSPIPAPGPEENIQKGAITHAQTTSRVLRKINLKVAAQKVQDYFVHNLIINCDDSIKNAELELFVSGDNDRDDGIAITSTDMGKIEGNKLKSVSLSAGKNQIKIRFDDNIKHSVRIKAYEIQ